MPISDLFNVLHMIFLFSPIIIFFIDKKWIKGWFKFLVLIMILTPLHWRFFDGECISTVITKKTGDFRETETTSSFSEKYLKWLYKPLMTYVFNLEWNNDGIGKMIHVHWILNFILIWYFIFFRYCPK